MFNLAQLQAFVYKNYLVIAVVVIAALVYYYQVYLPKKKSNGDLPIGPPVTPPVVDNTAAMEAEVQRVIQNIRSTPEWIAAIIQKATDNGVTVNAQLRGDAIYILQSTPGANPNNYNYSTFA
jgi:hypothetical protein